MTTFTGAGSIRKNRWRSPGEAPSPAIVNGGAGIIVASGDHVIGVAGITVAGDRIAAIDLITDQAKLRDTHA